MYGPNILVFLLWHHLDLLMLQKLPHKVSEKLVCVVLLIPLQLSEPEIFLNERNIFYFITLKGSLLLSIVLATSLQIMFR